MKKLLLFIAACLLTACASSTSVAVQSCLVENCDIAAVHSHAYWGQ